MSVRLGEFQSSSRGAWLAGFWPVTVLLAIASLPVFLDGYSTFQLAMVANYALALLGIVVLTGYCGQISLGQGAFFGLGAYIMAALVSKCEISYLLAVPVAGAVSFVLGAAFSFPALRLKGIYLALATFALAVAFPQLLRHPVLEPVTGGVLGIALGAPEPPSLFPISSEHWVFLISLFTLALAVYATGGLLYSRIGRAFIAIRDNPIAAAAMGINLPAYKALAFAFSALLTGVAGALSAIAVQYVAPDSFNMFLSITLLIGAVVGGLGSIGGVVIGALFIQFTPNLAAAISKSAPGMLYGLALILIVIFLPEGGASLFTRALGLRRKKTSEASHPMPAPAAFPGEAAASGPRGGGSASL
jgi:branched-chain amino acid transport system permease protein